MNSLDVIIWSLVSFGITITVTQSYIFEKVRNAIQKVSAFLGKLIHCPMCFSFWVGMLLTVLWKPLTNCILLDGFFSVGINLLLYSIVWKLAFSDDNF
jgi:hypothetical protein